MREREDEVVMGETTESDDGAMPAREAIIRWLGLLIALMGALTAVVYLRDEALSTSRVRVFGAATLALLAIQTLLVFGQFRKR